MRALIHSGCLLALALAACAASAAAQNVKITPLGSHAGELCSRDRATIFEDLTGVRILYDAGQTVTGADDPRLGSLHVVLLSHAHGDHIGDMKLKALEAGTCGNPELVSAAPNSTTGEIAAAKNAAIVMVAPLAAFIGKNVENIKGKPTPNCPQSGDDLVAPFAASCLTFVMIGGTRYVKTANATHAVEITIVTAAHDSTVPRSLLIEPERKNLEADNVGLTLGSSTGYVIKFTNGLTVYLSGDTALHADMKSVDSEYHKANLMLLNLGYNAITAQSGAYAANELVRPASVIVTHVNEGAISGGKVLPTSHTAVFMSLVKGRPVYPALSGKTMEFDGSGKVRGGVFIARIANQATASGVGYL
jgi:L-ascorbate metabolism protein UlaG (beta-lactamase superfamily)